ncbi:unnamed protein product [Urochloa humidicola]
MTTGPARGPARPPRLTIRWTPLLSASAALRVTSSLISAAAPPHTHPAAASALVRRPRGRIRASLLQQQWIRDAMERRGAASARSKRRPVARGGASGGRPRGALEGSTGL